MAHFAEINSQNVVLRTIVISNEDILDENGIEQESLGIALCKKLFGGDWKQTSYNSSFRSNFAGVGYTYDSDRDAFIRPKPFESWSLNEQNQWIPPVERPEIAGKSYHWSEELLNWVEDTQPI